MTWAATILLLLLIVAVVAVMVRDAASGDVPGLSNRNLFLIGFIYFQPMSGIVTLVSGQNERGLYLNDEGRSGLGFAAMSWVFFVLFRAFDRLGRRTLDVVAKPRKRWVLGPLGITMASILVVSLGLFMRFVLGYVPILGVITVQLSVGALTAGCCLMMYEWSKNFWNLAILAGLLVVVVTAIAALLVNAFGRREILGVFMSMAWMLYFLKWRQLRPAQLILRGGFWVVLTLAAMVLFSAARSGKEKERGVGDYIDAVRRVDSQDLWEQVVGGVGGQFAGGTSMWVYETRPDTYRYEPLHSLVYFVTFPIPRQFWPEKPNSLGRSITVQSGIGGVSVSEHSFGPGLVGHLANDYPPISVPLYAFLLAFLFRYLDKRLQANLDNPYELAVLGVGISQTFAIPRGELGLFLINALGTMAGAWIAIRCIAPIFGKSQDGVDQDDSEELPEPSLAQA